MRHSLVFSLGLSLMLHGLALYAGSFLRFPDTPSRRIVFALLRSPEKPRNLPLPQGPEVLSEPGSLLNNAAGTENVEETPLPPGSAAVNEAPQRPEESVAPETPATPQKKNGQTKKEIQSVQKKPSPRLFYPREAIERGLEGTVHLIVRFANDGSVINVGVTASSGHALLDDAAVQAVYAMGRKMGVASGELALPVRFRLED
ncbi:MAG: TonB family protein [Candidatus Accumulibacter sp.]|jgi:protein TonB|nr:TonB family protein [Accumulibacter sp.]